jgi:anti-anti-sigma regulatory factor
MVAVERLNEGRPVSALRPETFAIEGTFDRSIAERISGTVARAATRIVLDFRRVSTFQDAALANLADLLSSYGPGKIALTGLRPHQRRILRYLGVDPEQFERA